MPMFGAPRTARRAIASAVSRAPVSESHVSAPGSSVWSRIESRRPSQRTAWMDGMPTTVTPCNLASAARGPVPYCCPLVLPLRLAAPLAAVLSAAVPAVAHAGDPIMPLAQVRAGMHCTGYSVIRGTDISSFDVDVIDVLAGPDAQILVKVSGPAVDASGIAEGFSGS